MFDAHYDLLTVAYCSYLRNDYTYLSNFVKNFNHENVTSLIANLYFMSKKEMQEELGKDYFREDVSVLEMFKKAKEIVNKYLPKNITIIYSIEGCDYIKDEQELLALYKEGLRSIILTWNEKNKYASGNRHKSGLTPLGCSFIKKAIDLGIGIDLSHANKQSFYDIIKIIKEEKNKGKSVVCYASHSNALCDRERNLDDQQLEALKQIDALVGVFSHKKFVTSSKCSIHEYGKKYLEQICYVIDKLGNIKNVMLSTDDMSFASDYDPLYATCPIFPYSTIKKEITNLLATKFSQENIDLLLRKNAINRLQKLVLEER